MSPHPDVAREQRYIDHAYRCLDAMRDRTAGLSRLELGGTEVDSQIVRHELEVRLASMHAAGPLCFGRIDGEDDAVHYIGRRHVKDVEDRPVVVDWRAAVATPFYRATVRDALGLVRRRRFVLAGRELTDIFEESFGDPDSDAGPHGGIPDPLLAELGRARTGEMRDIVATIQAEQDEIIRMPIDRLVLVQGGPGTGKTAVALHRAAFLLYEHRERLEREQVLIVGPNEVFLEYIAQVLPSLGETSVRQTTVEGLLAKRYPVAASDPAPAARIKGDPRMAAVVARACRLVISRPDEDLKLLIGGTMVRVGAEEIELLIDDALGGGRPLQLARDIFNERLEHAVWSSVRLDVSGDPDDFFASLRRHPDFRKVRDRIWPSVAPAPVVRAMKSSPAALRRAAAGILDDGEQEALQARKGSARRWTRADLALLDEAEVTIRGRVPQYGHVVVDEAQDLSPMELRMLGRRSKGGSMTVLGDLAQATGIWAQSNWGEVAAHLDAPARLETPELSIGYRVPAPILDFANRLLATAAPDVRPARSIRIAGLPPRSVHAPDQIGESVRGEAVRLAAAYQTVGVIAADPAADAVRAAFAEHGTAVADEVLGTGITLLAPAHAKGLEFDAVVVVEPGAIAAAEAHGERMLYIAMTRAVQELVLVHASPLPAALAAALRDQPVAEDVGTDWEQDRADREQPEHVAAGRDQVGAVDTE